MVRSRLGIMLSVLLAAFPIGVLLIEPLLEDVCMALLGCAQYAPYIVGVACGFVAMILLKATLAANGFALTCRHSAVERVRLWPVALRILKVVCVVWLIGFVISPVTAWLTFSFYSIAWDFDVAVLVGAGLAVIAWLVKQRCACTRENVEVDARCR